jgi:hypothetical protein
LTSAGFVAAAALVEAQEFWQLAGDCASAEIQSYSGLTGQFVPECPSPPAPTVQPTRVSEAAKLNGVTTVGFVKTH